MAWPGFVWLLLSFSPFLVQILTVRMAHKLMTFVSSEELKIALNQNPIGNLSLAEKQHVSTTLPLWLPLTNHIELNHSFSLCLSVPPVILPGHDEPSSPGQHANLVHVEVEWCETHPNADRLIATELKNFTSCHNFIYTWAEQGKE